MKVSRFQKWKNQLPRQISRFSIQADESIGWEAVVHRHSAAEILVWILDKTGATLRKSQLVEAWFSVVRECWNLMDIDCYSGRNHRMILGEIQYFVEKSQYKKDEELARQRTCAEREMQQKVLVATVSGGVRRVRRALTTETSGRTEYFEKRPIPWILYFAN